MNRTGWVVAASVLTMVAASSAAVISAPASALPLSKVAETAMYGPDTTVTSSTGHHLGLGVEAITDRGEGMTQLIVDVYQGAREDHSWWFQVPNSEFLWDASTGQGSLDTQRSISPYGSLALTMVSAGPATTKTCNPASKTVTQPVTVTGTITFHTHSIGPTAWGTVSASSDTATFKESTTIATVYGTFNKSCQAAEGSFPCEHQAFWYGPGGFGGLLIGQDIKQNGHVYASVLWDHTETPPNSPPNSSRDDFSWRKVPLPTISRHGNRIRLVVHGNKSAGVTGSAVLTATGKPQHKRLSCGGHSEPTATWAHASFHNGAVPLTIANQIFGDGHNHNSAHGGLIAFDGVKPPPAGKS